MLIKTKSDVRRQQPTSLYFAWFKKQDRFSCQVLQTKQTPLFKGNNTSSKRDVIKVWRNIEKRKATNIMIYTTYE